VTVEFVRPEVETAGSGDIQRTTFEFTSADTAGIEEELLRRYDEIERSQYLPLRSAACRNCDVVEGLCSERAGQKVAG
jgi:hypothetical protein